MAAKNIDRVLLLCEYPEEAAGLARLFESSGFAVHCHKGPLGGIDLAEYGAVVHMAHSPRALQEILGDELERIRDEEWVLIEGDEGEADYHCTVQLTKQASHKLRTFVRMLWAQFNIT